MADVFVQFGDPVRDETGRFYTARACGAEMRGGRWQGWIEFLSADGREALRSGRETTQPNRTDAEYWATGLTAVYLEGALQRAMKPRRRVANPAVPPPLFDPPAESSSGRVDDIATPAPTESILNPFSVYRKGESLLRGQLAALSVWHLVNIIRAHGLSEAPSAALNKMTPAPLIEIIVTGVRQHLTTPG